MSSPSLNRKSGAATTASGGMRKQHLQDGMTRQDTWMRRRAMPGSIAPRIAGLAHEIGVAISRS
jgi:hypothetical protein